MARDRRRVWAGRAPELDDVVHGAPGLIAREERTGRAFNAGATVKFDRLEAGTTRVVWDPRRKLHAFVKAVHVEEHDERRGGVPPLSSKWHTARARNKRELPERVADCGKAESTQITVVCRDCKHSKQIPVGCGCSWFCPECNKRAIYRIQSRFLDSRHGLLMQAARAGLTKEDDAEAAERDRLWGRKRKPRRAPLGGFWGEKFLTLTLPPRGGVKERIDVMNATCTRFFRTLLERLRPSLQGPSGIRGEHLPRGVSEAQAENAIRARRSWRAAATHRADAPTLERFDSAETGDFELPLIDLFSYFRVVEWTPGKDGMGHPHVHVWMFSQYLEQAELERLWREAWGHVQRQRLYGGEVKKHGPIEQCKTIVHIEAARDRVEKELIKYLTKDWELDEQRVAKRVDPEVFAQVYAALDGRRRRQSSAGFNNWATEKLNECPCCGFSRERGSWARVDIEHALDEKRVKEEIGTLAKPGHAAMLFWDDPDDPDTPWVRPPPRLAELPMVQGGEGDIALRAEHDAEQDADWLDSFELRAIAARMRVALADPAEDWER